MQVEHWFVWRISASRASSVISKESAQTIRPGHRSLEFGKHGACGLLSAFRHLVHVHAIEQADVVHSRTNDHIRFFQLKAKFGNLAVAYVNAAHENIERSGNSQTAETR